MDNELITESKIPQDPAGWLETKLPKTVMMRLQSYIEEAKKNPISWNKNLAGNITKSLILKDKDNWFFKIVLLPLIDEYMKCYPLYSNRFRLFSNDIPYNLELESLWVNFQKENEFNPLHEHGGVLSFVIWVKIPTDWKEQHALPISANSNKPKASNFEFRYITMLGEIGHYEYLLNKESEGGMILFPAKLMHTVYPFYNCDKERISISGNICIDIS